MILFLIPYVILKNPLNYHNYEESIIISSAGGVSETSLLNLLNSTNEDTAKIIFGSVVRPIKRHQISIRFANEKFSVSQYRSQKPSSCAFITFVVLLIPFS